MENKHDSDDVFLKMRDAGIDVSQLTELFHENLLKPKLDEEKKRVEQELREIREEAKTQAKENLRVVKEKIHEIAEETRERITASEKLVDAKMTSIEFLKWTFAGLLVVLGLVSTISTAIGWSQKTTITKTTTELAEQLNYATTQAKRLNKTADVYHEQLLQTILRDTEFVMARLSSHISRTDRKRFGDILGQQGAILSRMSPIFERDASSTDVATKSDQMFRDTVGLFEDVNRGLVSVIEVISLKSDNPRLSNLFNDTDEKWQSIRKTIQNRELSLELSQKNRLEAYSEYALGTLHIHRFRKQRKRKQRLDNAQQHFETAEKLYPNFARSIGMQGFVYGQRHSLLEASPAYKNENEETLRNAMELLEIAKGLYIKAADYSLDPMAKTISYNNAADCFMRMAKLASRHPRLSEKSATEHLEEASRIARDASRLHPVHPVIFVTQAEIIATARKLGGDDWSDEKVAEQGSEVLFLVAKAKNNDFAGFPDTRSEFRKADSIFFVFSDDPDFEEKLYEAAGY